MTKMLITASIAVSGLSLFFQTIQSLLWKCSLCLLIAVIAAKIAAALHRQNILGFILMFIGGAVLLLTINSSDYPDLKEADIRNLWLCGISGAITCFAGAITAFFESSKLRHMERLHANWRCIEHPRDYRY